MSLGGTGAARDVTAEEKTLFVGLKGAVEAQSGATYATFDPVSVRTQTVAGTNYFVKVNVGDDKAVHVRAHKPLSGDVSVAGVLSKAGADSLEFFEPTA